jgi:hypothetical protein
MSPENESSNSEGKTKAKAYLSIIILIAVAIGIISFFILLLPDNNSGNAPKPSVDISRSTAPSRSTASAPSKSTTQSRSAATSKLASASDATTIVNRVSKIEDAAKKYKADKGEAPLDTHTLVYTNYLFIGDTEILGDMINLECLDSSDTCNITYRSSNLTTELCKKISGMGQVKCSNGQVSYEF